MDHAPLTLQRLIRLGQQGRAGLCMALWAAAQAGAEPGPALAHLQSAQAHAAGQSTLKREQATWCANRQELPNPTQLQAALLRVEAEFKRAREHAPADARRWLVQRECLAYQARQLVPEMALPVWQQSTLQLQRLTHQPPRGWTASVRATTPLGPVAHSRVTFSIGSHWSCFADTNAQGVALCTLVDTHPHGPDDQDHHDEAEHAPLVISLQGSVTPQRVQWPSTRTVALPHNHRQPVHPLRAP